MKCYGFFRASAPFRMRIAFNLKGIEYESVPVNFRTGAQRSDEYLKINPQGRVPAVALDDGTVLTQSMAIMEYLDETQPEPAFLPADAIGRARVRALAQIVACDIHPLNNVSPLNFLKGELGVDEAGELKWYQHWVAQGFAAFEALLAGDAHTGPYCHGDTPGLADICLVPQVFNAKRYHCPLDDYPTLMSVFDSLMTLDAFDAAQPDKQPEAAEMA